MKKLNKKYTDSELAESFIFRSKITAQQKVAANKQLNEAIARQKEKTSEKEKMHASLMQMRFQMEDYVWSNTYDEQLSFSYFLRRYIKLRYRANKQFAMDINIEATELSLILNNHRLPSEKTIVRLELHSAIPAVVWYKLVEKQKEYELTTDKSLREKEIKHVRNRLELKV
jgi:hypothetical protein